MTILTLNPPSGKECEYHVWSDVVSCDDFHISLRDGSKIRKQLCAKVELLSVSDAPHDYNGYCGFVDNLLSEFATEHGFMIGANGYMNIGSKARFDECELLTHI